MELHESLNRFGLRSVVCMFCTWTWLTGRPQNEEAKCPRCGYDAGVGKFMVMKPATPGYVIVMPDPRVALYPRWQSDPG